MVEIRDFQAPDYEGVLGIDLAEQQAYRGAFWDAASEQERDRFLMTSPRQVALYESSGFCFVAESAGKVVGFLFALPLMPDVLVVDGVGVLQTWRRRGIGRLMYDALLRRARARGVRRVQALISLDNAASMALHESAGFVLRDRREAVLDL